VSALPGAPPSAMVPAMERALVTGGCGFLGSWIVRQLVEEGVSVRVLALPNESRENVQDLEVEVLEGDVLQTEDVRRAVTGVDTVFHTAAIYEDWAPDPTRMYDVNILGTFHVLAAAQQAKVERVIYTASIVSLGRSDGSQPADEQTPYDAWDIDFPYSRSKYFSRQIAECFSDFDLDVRVVCPGIVMGPGDLRPTPSGRLIINSFLPGPAPWFDGGASYVDVRDAARVHLLAASRGRAGERYLAAPSHPHCRPYRSQEDLGRRVGNVVAWLACVGLLRHLLNGMWPWYAWLLLADYAAFAAAWIVCAVPQRRAD